MPGPLGESFDSHVVGTRRVTGDRVDDSARDDDDVVGEPVVNQPSRQTSIAATTPNGHDGSNAVAGNSNSTGRSFGHPEALGQVGRADAGGHPSQDPMPATAQGGVIPGRLIRKRRSRFDRDAILRRNGLLADHACGGEFFYPPRLSIFLSRSSCVPGS